MSQQQIRQEARRRARAVQSEQRRARAEQEKRIEALAVEVLTATGERDVAVAKAERRVGTALAQMCDGEGLTTREAVRWCGEEITVKEAARLRRRVDQAGEEVDQAREQTAEHKDQVRRAEQDRKERERAARATDVAPAPGR